MTRWERIASELHKQRKTWASLAAYLPASKASVGNWKSSGVPAKHFLKIDQFLGKPLGWTEGGEEFVELIATIKRHDEAPKDWPFDLVSRDDYEALPLPLRYQVQVRMQDEITKALATTETKRKAA